METQQLVDLGKQMNLEGEELREFVRAEQALARDEIIRIREENKEEEAKIAERIRQHEKEVLPIQLEADRIHLQEISEMNDSAKRPRNSGRSPTLPVFSEANYGMDAYLQRFERYAENEGCRLLRNLFRIPFIRQSVGSLLATTRFRST